MTTILKFIDSLKLTISPTVGMRMLREHSNRKDLDEALDTSEVVPQLLFVHYSIYNFLNNAYPCSRLRAFSYPFENPSYFYTLDMKKSTHPSIHLAQRADVFDEDLYAAGLRLFLDKVADDIRESAAINVIGEAALLRALPDAIKSALPGHESTSSVAHNLFYMNNEQMDNARKIEFTLPFDYEFADILPEDAEVIRGNDEERESIQLIRDRLTYLPSASIRQSSSNEIVSHVLSANAGNMTQLYTQPDHRRQGLGHAVELRIAQKLIASGKTPFKAVPTFLTSLIHSSEDSPFWSLWTRDSIPVQLMVERLDKRI